VAGVDQPCALLDVITPPYSPASEAHAQQRFAYYQEFPYELHTNQSTITRVRIYTDSEY
jgi:hypothetical protein